MDDTERILDELASTQRHQLCDLAHSGVTKAPGIYALWHTNTLLYVGIARIAPQDTTNPQAAGVYGRLNTYRRCRLTSDFAIGCLLRYVVPNLDTTQRTNLADGSMVTGDVQHLVQQWVWAHVWFSAVNCAATGAVAAENAARRTGVTSHGRPVFNPA